MSSKSAEYNATLCVGWIVTVMAELVSETDTFRLVFSHAGVPVLFIYWVSSLCKTAQFTP